MPTKLSEFWVSEPVNANDHLDNFFFVPTRTNTDKIIISN